MARVFRIKGRDDFYGKVTVAPYVQRRVRLCSDKGVSGGWLQALQTAADRVAAGEPARMDTLRGIPRRILESLGLVSKLAEARGTTWADHVAAYVGELQRRGLSPKYCSNARMYLSEVGKACGWRSLRDVARPSWSKYIEAREGSPRTRNTILATVRTFLAWAIDNEYMDKDPLAKVKPADQSDPTRVRRAFNDEEIRAILTHGQRHEVAIRLALSAGLRWAEVRALEWRDLDLGPRPHVHLRPAATKSKRGDVLPLPLPLAALLEARRPIGAAPTARVTVPPHRDTWLRILKRAGVPYLDNEGRIAGFHSLRKTFVTDLQRAGVAPRVVQALARHTDPGLTHGTYTDLSLLDTFGAAQSLPTYTPPAAVALAEGTTDTPVVSWHHMRHHEVCKNGPQACKSLQDGALEPRGGDMQKPQQKQPVSAVSGGSCIVLTGGE
ncbi:MAG: tyrosine-type recombinase/integrase [Phycisphaerae bacterium]|nr:tyrosine-type recombinase/integrase [Phycisphaerae bacterium]